MDRRTAIQCCLVAPGAVLSPSLPPSPEAARTNVHRLEPGEDELRHFESEAMAHIQRSADGSEAFWRNAKDEGHAWAQGDPTWWSRVILEQETKHAHGIVRRANASSTTATWARTPLYGYLTARLVLVSLAKARSLDKALHATAHCSLVDVPRRFNETDIWEISKWYDGESGPHCSEFATYATAIVHRPFEEYDEFY